MNINDINRMFANRHNNSSNGNGKVIKNLKRVGIGLFCLIGLSFVTDFYTIIQTGQAGVVLRLGKYDRVMTEGINFKTPFIDKVIKMDVRDKNSLVTTEVSSKDMQTIKIKLNLIYALDKDEVGHIYQKYHTNIDNILIKPTLLEIVNSVCSQYNIEEFVAKRPEISKLISDALIDKVKNSGIIVKSCLLTEHDFSDQYNKSIEDKKVAEQNALKAQYDLERVKLEAEAQKQKQGALSDLILREKAIDKWDGKLPTYISGSNQLPFIMK